MRTVLASLAVLAGLVARPPPPSPRASTARHQSRQHDTPREREAGRYQYVPVMVPLAVDAGAAVSVELTTPAALDGDRVDLVWDGTIVGSATARAGRPAHLERTVDKDGYVRAHVSAAEGAPVAVTSPIYVEVRASR